MSIVFFCEIKISTLKSYVLQGQPIFLVRLLRRLQVFLSQLLWATHVRKGSEEDLF